MYLKYYEIFPYHKPKSPEPQVLRASQFIPFKLLRADFCQLSNIQCGENTGSMAAMLRGKLSKSEESYRKCSISAKLYFFRLITFLIFPQTVLIFFIAFLTFSDFPHFFLKSS